MRPSHVRSRPPRLRLAGIIVTVLALVLSVGTVVAFQESSAAALDHRLETAEFEEAVFRGGVHQPSVVTEDTQIAQRIYLVLDDETHDYVTIASTVRELLIELGITLGDDRAVSHDLDAPIVADDRIVIAWIDTRTVVEETVVPFGTVEIEDRALARGERLVVTEGRDGAATTTFLIRLADGREVLRTEILSTVHTPPRDEVVRVPRLTSLSKEQTTTAPTTTEQPLIPTPPSVPDQMDRVPEAPAESEGAGPTVTEKPEPTNTSRPTTAPEPTSTAPPTTAPPTTAPPTTAPPTSVPPTTVPPTTTPPTSSQTPEPTPTTKPPKPTPTQTPTPDPTPTPNPTPTTTKPPTQTPTPTLTTPSEPQIGPGIGRGTTPSSARALAKEMAAARGWGNKEYQCLNVLWMRESSWDFKEANPVSTARGIPQAMMSLHYGANWRTSAEGLAYLRTPSIQITWGLNYIAGRYATPCAAKASSDVKGWY